MMLYLLFFNLIISGFWCQDIEKVVIPQGEPFSFDCQLDESVYFGRRLNEWTEIQENNENYLHIEVLNDPSHISKNIRNRVKQVVEQGKKYQSFPKNISK